MSKDIKDVYDTNPSTVLQPDDLVYSGKSPYGVGNDSAIKYSDLADQITTGVGDVVGPASATNNAPAIFDGITGKLIKNSAALATDQVLAGTTGLAPKPYTLTPGSHMTSIVSDDKASTITFNVDDMSTPPLQNQLFIAKNGDDATGLTTHIFATLSGLLAAISPDETNQYVVYDVRGNASETAIELKPFVKIYGCNTNFIVTAISLAADWTTVTTDAYASISDYKTLQCGGSIFFDFSTAATGVGQRYKLFIENIYERFDVAALKVFGLGDDSLSASPPQIYVSNVNFKGISDGRDTWVELDLGVKAFFNSCYQSQIKVNNNAVAACTTEATIKSNIIYGRDNTGDGVSITQGTGAGVNTIVRLYDSQIITSGDKINLQHNNSGSTCTVNMDSESYAIMSGGGSGVQGVDYFINSLSNVSAINTTINSESFTPVNYTPIQAASLNYQNVISHLKGIDTALAGSVATVEWAPGYIYKCGLTWTNVGSAGHTIDIGVGYARDKDNSFNFTVAAPITLNITVSGVNGLDTGSATTATWYYVHLIGDSTNVNANSGIFSLSLTAPTIPAGFDKFRCVGMVKTTSIGTGVILSFTQFGKGSERTYYLSNSDSSFLILNNGNATSGAPGTVNASAVMSPLSQQVSLNFNFTPITATDNFFLLNQFGAAVISGDVMGQLSNGIVTIATGTNQQFNYFVDNSSDSLDLQGYSYIESLDI